MSEVGIHGLSSKEQVVGLLIHGVDIEDDEEINGFELAINSWWPANPRSEAQIGLEQPRNVPPRSETGKAILVDTLKTRPGVHRKIRM